jgi:hypothetical protein
MAALHKRLGAPTVVAMYLPNRTRRCSWRPDMSALWKEPSRRMVPLAAQSCGGTCRPKQSARCRMCLTGRKDSDTLFQGGLVTLNELLRVSWGLRREAPPTSTRLVA